MYLFRSHDRPWRRRNYFIKKAFQARFVMRFLAVVLTGSALSGYLLYSFTGREVQDAFYSGHIKLSRTGEIILPSLLKVNSGVLALVLLTVVVVVLVISNKVAGPLYRIGKSTEKIGTGDFSGDFRLRADDELKSLALSLEAMQNELREQFIDLKKESSDIERLSRRLFSQHLFTNRGKNGPDRGINRADLEELVRLARDLGRKLGRFKLERSAG